MMPTSKLVATCALTYVMLSVGAFAMAADTDWLVSVAGTNSYVTDGADFIEIGNGLVSRRFTMLTANGITGFATTDLLLNATLSRGGLQSAFRRITPESVITLDSRTYDIGGLVFQSKDLAYCNRTSLPKFLGTDPRTFSYKSHSVSEPVAPFPWTPGMRGAPTSLSWPPKGKSLSVVFSAPTR